MMKHLLHILSLVSMMYIAACTQSPPNVTVLQPGQVAVTAQDTIYSIAKAHDVSVRSLVETNHLKPPYILEEGQVLTIPCTPKHTEGTHATDDLEDLSQSSVALSDDAWKDVPLEADSSTGHHVGQGIEDDIVIPTSTLPVPGLAEDDPAHHTIAPLSENTNATLQDTPPLTQETKSADTVRSNRPSKTKKTPTPKSSSKGSKSFISPVTGSLEDVNAKHTASFLAHKQEDVLACQDGVVVYAGKCGQFHKDPALVNKSFVFVAHDGVKGGKWSTVYLGVAPKVKKGDIVKQGQILGACQGEKLLFQLRKDRIPVNPKSHLK